MKEVSEDRNIPKDTIAPIILNDVEHTREAVEELQERAG